MPYRSFHYLGELDDEQPDGFGVLLKKDSVLIGNFKEGKLYEGYCEIYERKLSELVPFFKGCLKKGKTIGAAKYYKNGSLVFEGTLKKGERNGVGREYSNGNIVYDGYYKNNLKHGIGKLYNSVGLIYDGEWKKDLRHGDGTEYNGKGLIIYQGEWERGVYDGKGKLYENGQCTEGKWEDGRLVKSISTSVFTQIARSTQQWFGNDSLTNSITELPTNEVIAGSQIEFISQLQNDITNHLSEEFEKRIEDRFGFWHLLRMIGQPWFRSDVKRAKFAEDYFCENLQSREMQQWINNRIEYYNQNTSDVPLNYVTLNKLNTGAIVDTNVAIKVFDREAMETTDVLVGVFIDIIICVVIAFIIGLIIGFFIPALVPYAFIVDIVMGIIAFGVGLYLSVFKTTTISLELESQIQQMLVDNYIQFLDANNIISQILGLL